MNFNIVNIMIGRKDTELFILSVVLNLFYLCMEGSGSVPVSLFFGEGERLVFFAFLVPFRHPLPTLHPSYRDLRKLLPLFHLPPGNSISQGRWVRVRFRLSSPTLSSCCWGWSSPPLQFFPDSKGRTKDPLSP